MPTDLTMSNSLDFEVSLIFPTETGGRESKGRLDESEIDRYSFHTQSIEVVIIGINIEGAENSLKEERKTCIDGRAGKERKEKVEIRGRTQFSPRLRPRHVSNRLSFSQTSQSSFLFFLEHSGFFLEHQKDSVSTR